MNLAQGIRRGLLGAALGLLPGVALAGFTQHGELVSTNASPPAEQGYSVAISADGTTAVVGAPEDASWQGGAWVYTRVGSVWTQQAKLLGSSNHGFESQGLSVALSADGNTAILGGGAVWIFTRSGGVWTQQTKLLDTDGYTPIDYSVSLSADGNTAVIGSPGVGRDTGSALVYVRSGGTWSEQAELIAADAVGAATQGYSVAVSADGNTAIVGGVTDNNFTGAAWIYTRSRGSWKEKAKLVGTDAVGAAEQGVSVSISADGTTAIIGGYADNNSIGAAWVFTRSHGAWIQQGAKLVGSDAVGAAFQGWSVALSGNGNIAVVGGDWDNNFTGAAWVFRRLHGVWAQQGEKLVNADVAIPTMQGFSVSLSDDGTRALVGAPVVANGMGAAWVYVQPTFAGTPGRGNCFGRSVAALRRQYRGLGAAAAALGFPSIPALKTAIVSFCSG